MLPGNVDPRRADKQQRYKPPPSSNNAAPGEDLTPDYMNILDSQKKSMHSSNRSDRFKVVKIESTEPFKRGRWECMDFLDQSYSRILQHNYVACKSSDTNVSTTNGSRLEPPKRNTSTSWGTNNDLQSSMLRIFYRQNTSIAHDTSKSCTPKRHSAESAEALNQALYSDNSYRNHVLRPGMVSSSLVGVKYPFELNFEVNTDPAISNNSGAILSQQTCPCNNNYSPDVSNNLVIKTPEISTEPQPYIQNTSVPTYQQFNYAQQNYSTPNNNGQNIYQNGNGTTVNMFQNFNTSPRQQVNSFQISNNANGIFSVPTTVPVNTYNTSFGTDVYSYSDPNNVAHIVPTTNGGSSSASNYQQCPIVQQPSYQSQNTVTTTPILNTSQFENPPMYETLLQNNQSQCKFNTSTPTNNSIGNESVQVQGMSQLKLQQTNQQNVHMTMINNHHSGIVHVIKTNVQSSTACVNNQNQGTTHKTSPPNCQRVLFPDTLPSTNGVYTTSFVVPVYPQEENVAQNIAGNVSNPGYVAIPSNITPEQTNTVAPSQPLSPSQHRAVEACVYSILGVEKVPSTTNVNDAPTPINAKIEALMDLVTNHLKVAVLNDMQELKQHIEALNERIAELERENTLLKCMIFSMCGLMMRLKWCAWVALYCSCISFANSRLSDDTKQILSSFMLSISAVVMSYLQNPQPMTPPWASAVS